MGVGDFFQAGGCMTRRIRMEYAQETGAQREDTRVEVVIDRDGGLEHAVDAFRAFLVAMGFQPETIDKEVLRGDEE